MLKPMFSVLMGLVFVFILFDTSLSNVIKDKSFSGVSNGTNVILRWITENEANVSTFEVERRTGSTGEFSFISSINARHNPSQYEFIDYSAFKANGETLYQYRIKIIFNEDNHPEYSEVISVSHFVSGVRKTWGSIKAMFR